MPYNTSAVKQLFARALEIEAPEARSDYLRAACSEDAGLRGEVEALLEAHGRADGFLSRAEPDRSATIIDASKPLPAPDETIGPYKLREQIGEGGMGIVYVAEQDKPIRRKVALKIIKPGMDSKEVAARFEAERQALALMDHPHVARVIDAGTTERGRPYFVMELVRGFPITDYCDQAKLGTRARLELFLKVCQGVQHAHLKGIIHRDIKPSNVMVTLHDSVPVPKVIDFGVAKALHQRLTERTIYTQFHQMVGTPAYMSPEQAEMSGLDVDTRTDVYSLGVLLYELLTGCTPFDKETLKSKSFDDLRRMIRELDPPRPSQRISTLNAAAQSTLQAQRGIDARQLSQSLKRELDWIVMKALEKDRNRRYESASAFAQDIERYLHDEPVAACPPSTVYRLRKAIRRNKTMLTTGGLVALALIAGTTVSLRQAARATTAELQVRDALHEVKSERDRAVDAERRAQASFASERAARVEAQESLARARDAVDRFFTLVSQDKLFDVPTLQPLRKDLLEAAIRYYATLAEQRPDDSSLIADLAVAHLRITTVFKDFDRMNDAIDSLAAGLDQIDRLRREFPEAREDRTRLAGFWKPLRSNGTYGRPDDADKVNRTYKRLVETYTSLHQEFPEVEGFESDLAAACFALGNWQMEFAESRQEGLVTSEESLARWERLCSAHPENPDYFDSYLETLADVGYTLRSRRFDLNKGEVNRQQLMQKREEAYQRFPEIPRFREFKVAALRDRGKDRVAAGQLKEGCDLFRQELDLARTLCREFPGVMEYVVQFNAAADRIIKYGPAAGIDESHLVELRREVAAYVAEAQRLGDLAFDSPDERWTFAEKQYLLGENLWRAGDKEAAGAVFRRVAEATRKLATEFPNEPKYRLRAAHSLRMLCSTVGKDEQCDLFREALHLLDQLYQEDPENPDHLRYLLDTQRRLVSALQEVGRSEDADAFLEELNANLAPYADDAQFAFQLAWLHNERAWSLVENAGTSDRNAIRSIAEAEASVKLAPAQWEFWNTLGVAHFRGRNWDAAETALRKSMDLNKGGYPADWFFMAMIDWQRGQKDRARHWFDAAAMWTARYASNNEEVIRFRAEAQGLLGMTELTIPDEFDDGTIGNELLAADGDLEGYLVFRAKADAAIREFDWKGAAPHALRAAEVLPDDNNLDFQLSAILARAGDVPAYRQVCHRMLERNANTIDPMWAERTAKVCLLLPAAGDDLEAASRLSQRALTLDEAHWVIPYAQVVAGMAAYRRREFIEAVDWCDKALTKESENVWFRNAEALFVRALARAGLGHQPYAVEDYTRASDILKQAQVADKASPAVDPAWQDFAMCELLQQEAAQTLNLNPETPPVSEPQPADASPPPADSRRTPSSPQE